jgi:hypothetical protein
MAKYGLEENEFLQRAYDNREMWAKPFFAETFCAGMTSTQRSESANHLLKTYISCGAPMHHFVSQYNKLIADRISDEARESHATKQVRVITKTYTKKKIIYMNYLSFFFSRLRRYAILVSVFHSRGMRPRSILALCTPGSTRSCSGLARSLAVV